MLKIEGIKLPVGCGEDALSERVRKLLRLRNAGDLLSLTLLRRSIDAREGVQWVCAAAAETAGAVNGLGQSYAAIPVMIFAALYLLAAAPRIKSRAQA